MSAQTTSVVELVCVFCVFRSNSPPGRTDGRRGDRRASPQHNNARPDRDRMQKSRPDAHHRDKRHRSRSLERHGRDRPKDIHRSRDHDRSRRSRSPRDCLDHRRPERKRSNSRERHRHRQGQGRHKHESSHASHSSKSSGRGGGGHRESSFERDLKREKYRQSEKNGV